MPSYLIRVTKTETRVYTVEKTVEIPTDDPVKALAYAEVAAGFDQYDSKSLLRHIPWGSPAETEIISCELMFTEPVPDFDEVPAPPPPVRLEALEASLPEASPCEMAPTDEGILF